VCLCTNGVCCGIICAGLIAACHSGSINKVSAWTQDIRHLSWYVISRYFLLLSSVKIFWSICKMLNGEMLADVRRGLIAVLFARLCLQHHRDLVLWTDRWRLPSKAEVTCCRLIGLAWRCCIMRQFAAMLRSLRTFFSTVSFSVFHLQRFVVSSIIDILSFFLLLLSVLVLYYCFTSTYWNGMSSITEENPSIFCIVQTPSVKSTVIDGSKRSLH